MPTIPFRELLERLRAEDESVLIEAKESGASSNSVMETVSAFSNEPGRGGGYLLFGVRATEGLFPDYEVVGVRDPDRSQADLATQCREMLHPAVRPLIQVEQHDGRTVMFAFVPEAAPQAKPVYISKEGLPGGAYRRIGSTDQHCTDDDIALLYQGRGHATFDASALDGTSLADVDPQALEEYRRLRREANSTAAELRLGDTELLYSLGASTGLEAASQLTMAGLVLFGRETSLRRVLPMTRIDYIRVEGREWVPDPERRYASIDMRGPLILLIPRVIANVAADLPTTFSLPVGGVHRRDLPLVPTAVLREAIVNALMHRSYRAREAVQIIRYSNRLEIRNPGHSLVPDDHLGDPGSRCRNESLAAVLHEVRLAETKGTGIRAMREAMARANLTLPVFESDWQKDTFTVRLLVLHLLGPDEVRWLETFADCSLSGDEAKALIVVREIGAIDNSVFRDINGVDTLTASGSLRRMRDLGLLEQRGKGRATYYVPTDRVRSPVGVLSPGVSPGDKPLPPGLGTLSPGLGAGRGTNTARTKALDAVPPYLAAEVNALGKRAEPPEVRSVILRLCGHRPMTPAELAVLLDRNREYIQKQYLGPMVEDGNLEYTHPENPAHPGQAYKRRLAAT